MDETEQVTFAVLNVKVLLQACISTASAIAMKNLLNINI